MVLTAFGELESLVCTPEPASHSIPLAPAGRHFTARKRENLATVILQIELLIFLAILIRAGLLING